MLFRSRAEAQEFPCLKAYLCHELHRKRGRHKKPQRDFRAFGCADILEPVCASFHGQQEEVPGWPFAVLWADPGADVGAGNGNEIKADLWSNSWSNL